MKELKFGKLKSAFDIKIYTATSNSPNSIDQLSTPQGLTTTNRVSSNDGTNVERKLKHENTTVNQISLETISKILTEKDNLNQTLILLVTYLRSGSTFTADLIQQASDVFYLYEPLKPYVRGEYYFTLDSVCHIINGTCR